MSSQSGRQRGLAVRVMLVTVIVFLSWSVDALAASDACAALKPEEISKVFGEAFGPPARQATPAGRFAGASVTCTYTGKTLTFAIRSYEYLNADSRARNWEVRRTRSLASKHAEDLPSVGEGALYMRDAIESYQGLHDHNFSVVPSGSSVNVDRKEQLITIAKLFYSRLQ